VRYFLISSHYRSQLNYSAENLQQAHAALGRLYNALRDVKVPTELDLSDSTFGVYLTQFNAAMNDDFNTALALPVLFELARDINKEKATDPLKAGKLAWLLVKLGEVLGILQGDAESFLQAGGNHEDVAAIEALIAQRNAARAAKDWAAADAARAELTARGIVVEDKNGVSSWRRG